MPVFKKPSTKKESETTAVDDFGATQAVKVLDSRLCMDCYRFGFFKINFNFFSGEGQTTVLPKYHPDIHEGFGILGGYRDCGIKGISRDLGD